MCETCRRTTAAATFAAQARCKLEVVVDADVAAAFGTLKSEGLAGVRVVDAGDRAAVDEIFG